MKRKVLMVFAVAIVALTVTDTNAQPAPQSSKEPRGVTPYPEVKDEPAPKLIVDPPLPDLLANTPSVVWIQYRVENLHIVPVFGPEAVAVLPDVGRIHVARDDFSWVWADASGNPIILQGLSPGLHKVRIDLGDANDHQLDTRTITFAVPAKTAAEQHQ